VKQAAEVTDWVPWRRVKRPLAVLVVLTAVVAPKQYEAGMLAYARDETAIVGTWLKDEARSMMCQALENTKQTTATSGTRTLSRLWRCPRAGEKEYSAHDRRSATSIPVADAGRKWGLSVPNAAPS
jgi:hypothetical protein